MGITYNPKMVTDGLVLCVDAASKRSYPGTGTVWTDLVGENDGTLTNGPTFSSANGGSIVFDGSDDTVATTLSPSLASYTISMWVKTSSSSSEIYIDSYISANYIRLVVLSTGVVQFPFRESGTEIVSVSSTSINDGEWHHITGTRDAGVIGRVYVDGVADGSATDTTAGGAITPGVSLDIGRASGNRVSGKIASVQIYNSSLTADEVLQNYLATRGRFGL